VPDCWSKYPVRPRVPEDISDLSDTLPCSDPHECAFILSLFGWIVHGNFFGNSSWVGAHPRVRRQEGGHMGPPLREMPIILQGISGTSTRGLAGT
jgi:hypothetical protein